jgi:hypothetical protein
VKNIPLVQNGGVSRNEYIERTRAGSMSFGAKLLLFGLRVSAGSDVTLSSYGMSVFVLRVVLH